MNQIVQCHPSRSRPSSALFNRAIASPLPLIGVGSPSPDSRETTKSLLLPPPPGSLAPHPLESKSTERIVTKFITIPGKMRKEMTT